VGYLNSCSSFNNLPSQEHSVSYLQVCIPLPVKTTDTVVQLVNYEDVNTHLNSLANVLPVHGQEYPFCIYIGKFSGRGETTYNSRFKKNCVFLFIIEGAFEVEGRLLHAGDGLAIRDEKETGIEALSNDAILLLLELTETVAI